MICHCPCGWEGFGQASMHKPGDLPDVCTERFRSMPRVIGSTVKVYFLCPEIRLCFAILSLLGEQGLFVFVRREL